MKIYSYGEDALTLWLFSNEEQTKKFLEKLNDKSKIGSCKLFYRPSFGRNSQSSFGEFDFIFLTPENLYLGESKWDKSGEIKIKKERVEIHLRDEQINRHLIFKKYLESWYKVGKDIWSIPKVEKKSILDKTIPKLNTLLAKNLETIFIEIKSFYNGNYPKIKNVLLYFYDSNKSKIDDNLSHEILFLNLDQKERFEFIHIPYISKLGNYIDIYN